MIAIRIALFQWYFLLNFWAAFRAGRFQFVNLLRLCLFVCDPLSIRSQSGFFSVFQPTYNNYNAYRTGSLAYNALI